MFAARQPSDIDFRWAGKQAYRLVRSLEPDDAAEERELFERLSRDFDFWAEGLADVRRAWGDAC